MDKLRLLYRQTGRAVWISHLDMMRMLQRAMNRAAVPIRYSEGFNPHAQISILLPLSVGTASHCQLVDIRVKEDVDIDTLPQRLNAVLPEGVEVLSAWENGEKPAAMGWLEAECRWDYEQPVTQARLQELRALFAREELIVTRRTKRGMGPFDLVPHIRDLRFSAAGTQVLLHAMVSAAEPVVKPELLSAAVSENAPALAPKRVECCRLELYTKDMVLFR